MQITSSDIYLFMFVSTYSRKYISREQKELNKKSPNEKIEKRHRRRHHIVSYKYSFNVHRKKHNENIIL